ncbi:uncharacterized protein METZ01_LOCUS12195 [marine metagenome]|uniref:Uncharacterized protein n=1 Tax=marine metagenome TaxID=408172 RepID=A0A381NXK8_9ZZZZ
MNAGRKHFRIVQPLLNAAQRDQPGAPSHRVTVVPSVILHLPSHRGSIMIFCAYFHPGELWHLVVILPFNCQGLLIQCPSVSFIDESLNVTRPPDCVLRHLYCWN